MRIIKAYMRNRKGGHWTNHFY